MADTYLRCTDKSSATGSESLTGGANVHDVLDDPVGAPDDATTQVSYTRGAGLDNDTVFDHDAFTDPYRLINYVTPFIRAHWTFSTTEWTTSFRGKAAYAFNQIAGGASGTAPTTYTSYNEQHLTCPDTAAAWLDTDLTLPQIQTHGNRVAGDSIVVLTQTYVQVNFEYHNAGLIVNFMLGTAGLLGAAALCLELMPGLVQAVGARTGTFYEPREYREVLDAWQCYRSPAYFILGKARAGGSSPALGA